MHDGTPQAAVIQMQALTNISIPRLYERDIDILMQEELLFNGGVKTLFGTVLKLSAPIEVSTCRLSVWDNTGETDIECRFSSEQCDGVLLIENKIDAAFQPRQPERYQERAAALSQQLGTKVYCVLIAPSGYNSTDVANYFDAVVDYEKLADAIASESTDRAKHRAALIRHAMKLARRSYVLATAEDVTTLWTRVYGIASTGYTDLRMDHPGNRKSGSIWISFKAGLPPNITIDWKITMAVVDLSFWPSAPQKPTEGLDLADLGAFTDKTGNTALIRVAVSNPPVKWVDLTDIQIHEALTAASNLLRFYQMNPSSFA